MTNKLNSKSSRKLFIVNSLLFLISTVAIAQNSTNNFWQNVRFGGGLGLGWNSNYFSATVAPSAVYDFSDYFAFGIGLNATFASQDHVHKSQIIGGSLIALANPYEVIQLSAEFEELHVKRNYDPQSGLRDERYWYPALFLGIGYRTYNLTYGIRFDVLYDREKSIYADSWMPFIRVYF